VSSIIVGKAEKLIQEGKVKKEVETENRMHFTVEGTSEVHSIMFDKTKEKWSCDCSYNTLKGRVCSHIVACQKIMART
jgi:hypothetical protein